MKKRTTFYFPPEAARRLGQIRRRSRLESNAAVLRAALNAYAELLEVTQAGYKIVVRAEDGQETPFSPYEPFAYAKLEALRRDNDVEGDDKVPKNFVFPEAAAKTLEAIRNASYLDSNADAIRAALAGYDELTLVAGAGDLILIVDPTTQEQVAYTPFAPLQRYRLQKIRERSEADDPRPQIDSGGDLAGPPLKLAEVI